MNKSVISVSLSQSQVEQFGKDLRDIKRFMKRYGEISEQPKLKDEFYEAKWYFKKQWSGGFIGFCSRCGFESHTNDLNPFPKFCGGCGSRNFPAGKLKKLLEGGEEIGISSNN